jgi:hypothetical protein
MSNFTFNRILMTIRKHPDAVKIGEFANKILKKRTVNLEEILMRNRQLDFVQNYVRNYNDRFFLSLVC